MFRIKELEVTCCHACEKWGNLAALLGGLLLGRGLDSGLLLTGLTFFSPSLTSASVGSVKNSWEISSAKVRGEVAEVPKVLIPTSRGLVIKLLTTWVKPIRNRSTLPGSGNKVFIHFGCSNSLSDCYIYS